MLDTQNLKASNSTSVTRCKGSAITIGWISTKLQICSFWSMDIGYFSILILRCCHWLSKLDRLIFLFPVSDARPKDYYFYWSFASQLWEASWWKQVSIMTSLWLLSADYSNCRHKDHGLSSYLVTLVTLPVQRHLRLTLNLRWWKQWTKNTMCFLLKSLVSLYFPFNLGNYRWARWRKQEIEFAGGHQPPYLTMKPLHQVQKGILLIRNVQ